MQDKLCISNSKELYIFKPQSVVCVIADGNYVFLKLINGKSMHIYSTMEKVYKLLNTPCPNEFLRIGRSLIINTSFIHYICPLKGKLILSDNCTWSQTIELPQTTLIKLMKKMEIVFYSNN